MIFHHFAHCHLAHCYHLSWVTQARYWGPHTFVSASTDRSIALWDARVGVSPLFVLRYHHSPVSDLLVGSRNEFLMISAGGDGAVATWDFRKLSGEQQATSPSSGGGAALSSGATVATSSSIVNTKLGPGGGNRHQTKTIREPVATMDHCREGGGKRNGCSGTVLLSRGSRLRERSVLSVSVDGKIKEWDVATGRLLMRRSAGHTDVVSCLTTFSDSGGLVRDSSASARSRSAMGGGSSSDSSGVSGYITCSWDGTVRLRKLALGDDDSP